jgi:NTP pyrophosphatase (non-canonical NTP hydrolase)
MAENRTDILEFIRHLQTAGVGEARATRKEEKNNIGEEVADVIFSAISLAKIFDVQIEPILKEKYLDRPLSEVSQKLTDVTWK